MKLPDQDVLLAGGLRCASRDLDPRTWQAHLLKHPLGIHRRVSPDGKPLRWNVEQWDEMRPSVITSDRRDHLLARIGALALAADVCQVPEVRRRRGAATQPEPECYQCGGRLVAACDVVCSADSVGRAYADVTACLLLDLREGQAIVVERQQVARVVLRMFRAPVEQLRELTVLSVGIADRGSSRIARISRGDGVRTELYRSGLELTRWRTTYRDPPLDVNATLRFLLDMAQPEPGGALSDRCLVTRPWWEAHAL